MPLFHYSPPQVASRIVFPIDFDAIHKYKGEDSLERNFWSGRQVFPVPLVSMQQLENDMQNYLIVTTQGNWLLRQLEADGDPARTVPIYPDSRDIRGFTPLCHDQVFMFEKGDALGNERYASTRGAGKIKASTNLSPRERSTRPVGHAGMSQ
jgi:hypothetical protein